MAKKKQPMNSSGWRWDGPYYEDGQVVLHVENKNGAKDDIVLLTAYDEIDALLSLHSCMVLACKAWREGRRDEAP